MLTTPEITRVIDIALEEDAPWGDLTALALIPEEATAKAELRAREPGVFSGTEVFTTAFTRTDPTITTTFNIQDGDHFNTGDKLATVEGPARGVLTGERIALNFVQRMSGIATLTAEYVKRTMHTKARIVDTRKTTPGLRALERHAVRSGGGHNHRRNLSDAVMAKDNHLAVLLKQGLNLTEAIQQVRKNIPHTTHLEVEIDHLDQLDAVLAANVDSIMLDNFSLADLREGVKRINGRAIVEASGGVNLETVQAIAETGVDVISVGALTHSARALDLGLDMHIS
ncbi:carboxylating nicotinate-nucleotide diphosphorylase [Gulosibacter chungangensis]|uniref:Nicotinate-nucleotide pyrophosphorylase [carboxylating] n=1 Tax=Gulosibacter chungangensis TaxID=979746 RepID=A0A7J5B7J8_9MICO|nr:carboxylating nicotinate-nucleotide diphosphorylase [Gulosibacter chungangensis]KAB1640980.1 carboxylating nicotinate-nucleotide diphosphorylase [Gulosibacter chungangensis]